MLRLEELNDDQIRAMVNAISEQVVAVGISAEDYMARFAGDYCEWIAGVVIKMPANEVHDRLFRYLLVLLNAYLDLRPIGQLRQAPFVMRARPDWPHREPDIQMILNAHLDRLTPTYVDGPADLCIEIVSPESIERDHGDKFREYQEGGVTEYWIIDPTRAEARFYRMDETGTYRPQTVTQDIYRTPLLPGLDLHVPTLWQAELPGAVIIVRMVEKMLSTP
jgi:Uma2 family endonuclease